jgi:hypothetical protein
MEKLYHFCEYKCPIKYLLRKLYIRGKAQATGTGIIHLLCFSCPINRILTWWIVKELKRRFKLG